MTAVHLAARLFADTFAQLRACGAGRAECVVYWCADRTDTDLVTRVVHPVHRSGAGWYKVDSAWVTRFFLDLRVRGEVTRVQVHTHPARAGHSATDDRFALAPAAGFLSLVLPTFATGPVDLTGSALMRMDARGEWSPVEPGQVIRVG